MSGNVFLFGLVALSIAALPCGAQFADSEESAVSLGGAPVGLYSKSRSPYGEEETAASLGGAPVGLYSKRRYAPQQPYYPQPYRRPYPQPYRPPYRQPYPMYPPFQGGPPPDIYPDFGDELDSDPDPFRIRFPFPCRGGRCRRRRCRGRRCRRPCRGRRCRFPDFEED